MLSVLLFCTNNGYGENLSLKFGRGYVVLPNQDISLNVEVAFSENQRATGLMNRKYLSDHAGMLFVFEHQGLQRVWMKDTLISLDVVFISAEEKIVSIFKDLQPCIQYPCPIFSSAETAKYMLELNTGMIQKNKIKIGQRVLLKIISKGQ